MAENPYFVSVGQPIPGQIVPSYGKTAARSGSKAAGADFGQVFEEKLQEAFQEGQPLKFSRHAQERLDARNIRLTPQHLERLDQAVSKARGKGARDSLVLLDDMAFVVSVRNRTVITAVDGEARQGNVFTNIDCAVIN
jgi:flagellar operon protein